MENRSGKGIRWINILGLNRSQIKEIKKEASVIDRDSRFRKD